MKGFKVELPKNATTLILGSMPSVTSLQDQEYYAFPRNRFWKIMERYANASCSNYEDKLFILQTHHIALWDVVKECEREGSLDSNIKNVVYNDIETLLKENPSIERILCNGKKAYTLYLKKWKHLSISCICLPSTSNANQSMKEEELISLWIKTLEKR